MKKNKLQFAWHVHHDKLIDPLTHPISVRRKYIKENKPKEEIPLRLKLLKVVKGKLPKEYVEAGKTYDKAWKTYDKAWKIYVEAEKTRDEARKTCDEAWKVYDEAEKTCDEARKTYKKEILALHKKECPHCPWNGESIF